MTESVETSHRLRNLEGCLHFCSPLTVKGSGDFTSAQ